MYFLILEWLMVLMSEIMTFLSRDIIVDTLSCYGSLSWLNISYLN